MNKKVIFLDVDGTMTYRAEKVSECVIQAIREAKKNGHYIFICTGRNKSGIYFLKDLPFDGMITSAGGYIEMNGEVLAEAYLDENDLIEAREVFDKYGILYHMEATSQTYADERVLELFIQDTFDVDHTNSELTRMLEEQKKKLNFLSLDEYHGEPIHKISFIAFNKESLDKAKAELQHKYKFIIHDIYSTTTLNGEIIMNGVDKGQAVKKVIDTLQLSLEDTICFGDSMNDYEMLQICHHSVAMGNASEELKQHATTVCESVQDDGVYHELKRLHII